MNTEYERKLEAQADSLLKELPDLQAPKGLAARVMAQVSRRAAQPWYRQSWAFWPAAWRYVSLAIMLGGFGALCFASWELTRAAGIGLALQEVVQAFSGVTALWNAFVAVLNGLLLALKQIHPAILIGALTFLGLAWGLCVGLGTVCVRLALARR